jgi:hypothetical protein
LIQFFGFVWFCFGFVLEHFHKYRSHSVWDAAGGSFGLWLRFRLVTGRCGHAPLLNSRQNPKLLAAERLRYFFKRSGAKNAMIRKCP